MTVIPAQAGIHFTYYHFGLPPLRAGRERIVDYPLIKHISTIILHTLS